MASETQPTGREPLMNERVEDIEQFGLVDTSED